MPRCAPLSLLLVGDDRLVATTLGLSPRSPGSQTKKDGLKKLKKGAASMQEIKKKT